jgi:hypothetical protein
MLNSKWVYRSEKETLIYESSITHVENGRKSSSISKQNSSTRNHAHNKRVQCDTRAHETLNADRNNVFSDQQASNESVSP